MLPQMSPLMWVVFPFLMMVVMMFFVITLWEEELGMSVFDESKCGEIEVLKW